MTLRNASNRSIVCAALVLVAAWPHDAEAGASNETIVYATLGTQPVELPTPLPQVASSDTLTCFNGVDGVLLNPGCFATSNPTQAGDCASTTSQYLVQYLFPEKAALERLSGFGFVSNDATVFPSAGALLIPIVDNMVRFPTTSELASLQRTNVTSPSDMANVFVSLTSEQILVGPDTDAALVLVLQFPDGQLVSQNEGPAIAVESSSPDNDCDFFTIDSGTSGTWFAPVYDASDPNSLPLDWGFVAVFEPLSVDVELLTWSALKEKYGIRP